VTECAGVVNVLCLVDMLVVFNLCSVLFLPRN